MKFVCDAPGGKTWFRIETVDEAAKESVLMDHAVEKHFRQQRDHTASGFKPPSDVFIEQNIGLESFIQRHMPMFLTLRNGDGDGLATAMLPPDGNQRKGFRVIIVGPGNSDPYADHADAIQALARHVGLSLDREDCYPYRH